MLETLKKQPLVGLAVAIASGYVIAHFVIRFLDSLPSDFEQYPDTYVAVMFWVVIVAGSIFLYRKRRSLSAPIRRHKQKTAWVMFAGFLISAGNGGRVAIADLAPGVNGAQVKGATVAVFDFMIYLWIACIILAVGKVVEARRSGAQTQS